MTVTADADCKLTVNGKPHGTLTANQEKTGERPAVQSVKPGTAKDARVLCVSSAK